MSKPNEVLIGIQLGEDVHYVAGSSEDAIDSAWRILDSVQKSMVKGERTIPEKVINAAKLLEEWVNHTNDRKGG